MDCAARVPILVIFAKTCGQDGYSYVKGVISMLVAGFAVFGPAHVSWAGSIHPSSTACHSLWVVSTLPFHIPHLDTLFRFTTSALFPHTSPTSSWVSVCLTTTKRWQSNHSSAQEPNGLSCSQVCLFPSSHRPFRI